MNDDASKTMLINRGLSPDEQKRFGHLDGDTSTALISAGITGRCGWLARNENGARILELVVWTENERVVMQIPSTELLTIPDQTLLERLKKCLA